MLDWLTLSLPFTALSDDVRERLFRLGDRIMRYSPADGRLVWETSAWDSVRSDSHQVVYRVGSDAFHLQGSPARCLGDGDAVFGPPAAGAAEGARAMIRFVCKALGFFLPLDLSQWKCTRMDCTVHLLLADLPAVRQALSVLRSVEGGRYRVSAQAGDTVYWSHRSRLRAGKAYAKGPHLRYLQKKPDYSGRVYSPDEIELSDRLLRLELRLGSQYWRERAEKVWFDWSLVDIDAAAWDYFGRMISGSEVVKTNDDVVTALSTVMDSKGALLSLGQQQAVFRTWCLVTKMGWQFVRDNMSPRTYYLHRRYLLAAGLSDADISSGRIVELRVQRLSDAQRVSSWSQLRSVA